MARPYHDAGSGSIERGNVLGAHASVSVRQSRYFRQYESGNNVKALLGTGHLQWDNNKKEGVFAGDAVYDGRTQTYDYESAIAQPPPRVMTLPPRQSQGAAPLVPKAAPADQPSAARAPGRSSISHLSDALWSAVGAKDLEEVRKLIRQGGDPNMVCPDGWVRDECRPKQGDVGRSLLHHAAWAGDIEVFKFLVESGADVDRRRNTAWRPNGGVRGRGSTPLHHACMYNRQDIGEQAVPVAAPH
jgi:hypothetical protein